jgi:amino acid permease
MNPLILGAFYDSVNKSVGPTLMWVFFLLMIIEMIYVMAKYVDSGADDKK